MPKSTQSIIAALRAHVWPNTEGRIEQAAVDVVSALKAAGYVIVPVEPTEAMLEAGGTSNCMDDYPPPEQSWPAMIDAALAATQSKA